MSQLFFFKIRSACPECGEAIMIDGPRRTTRCLACQSMVDLDVQTWKRMMDFRHEDAKKKELSTVFGLMGAATFHTRMGRAKAPLCTACAQPLDVATVLAGTDGDVPCACGHAMSTFPTPEWMRTLDARAEQVFNAERETEASKIAISPAETKPVSFGCPDCGANLKITADAPRILECQYCRADLYLPDPLWRALHPVKKRATWYIAFKG